MAAPVSPNLSGARFAAAWRYDSSGGSAPFLEHARHYHGQIWNAAELARAMAVNESTVRRYLDLLTVC